MSAIDALIAAHAAGGGRPDRVSRLLGFDIDAYLDADQRSHRVWRDEEAERGIKAMLLAPTLQICRALLAGEQVPAGRLDQEQLARHRRRPGR